MKLYAVGSMKFNIKICELDVMMGKVYENAAVTLRANSYTYFTVVK